MHFLLLIILINPYFYQIQAFNIDTNFPIVIEKKSYFEKSFEKKSYFGASVALVSSKKNLNEADNANYSGWVLIGDPKGSPPDAEGVIDPGVIWRCHFEEIDQKNLTENLCQILDMDVNGERQLNASEKASYRENKKNMWNGGSMFIGESDRFVSCGYLWRNRTMKMPNLNGICYWIFKNETADYQFSVSHSESTQNLLKPRRRQLIPLANRNNFILRNPTILNWAVGQAGFSLHLTKNNHLILGAPGVLEWAGTVIEYRDEIQHKDTTSNENYFSSFTVGKYNSEIQDEYDYFGYAVTSGNFKKNSENEKNQYAAGAPRASHLQGKVTIFTLEEKINNASNIKKLYQIVGKESEFGSYFGSVLCSIDLNNDGVDELIIGAPMHNGQLKATRWIGEKSLYASTGERLGDAGCIFVYSVQNLADVICGYSVGSRFGSAIVNLGDLNEDRYKDLAVGAPYENDNRGAVYIFFGGSSLTLNLKQKIEPSKKLGETFGFGYSLSFGEDIDNNYYNDLAVGAYGSNKVIIYRTIPLIRIESNITYSTTKLLANMTEFNVTSCLKYTGLRNTRNFDIGNLTVRLSIVLDDENRNNSEFVSWNDSRQNLNDPNLLEINVTIGNKESCFSFKAIKLNNTLEESISQYPIKTKQLVTLLNEQSEEKVLNYTIKKNGNLFSTTLPNPSTKFSDFNKQVLEKTTDEPKYYYLPIGTYCNEDGDPSCLSHLIIGNEFLNLTKKNEFVIGSSDNLQLNITLENKNERANLPLSISVSWIGPTFQSYQFKCSTRPVDFQSNGEKSELNNTCTFDFKYALDRDDKREKIFELDMTNILVDFLSKEIQFNITAATSSELEKETLSSIKINLVAQFTFHVEGIDSFKVFGLNNEIIRFSQFYKVNTTGITSLKAAQIMIQIPNVVNTQYGEIEVVKVRRPETRYNNEEFRCKSVNGSFYIPEKNEIEFEFHPSYPDNNSIINSPDINMRKKRCVDCEGMGIWQKEKERVIVNSKERNMTIICDVDSLYPNRMANIRITFQMEINEIKKILEEEFESLLFHTETSVMAMGKNGVLSETLTKGQSKTSILFKAPKEIGVWIYLISIGMGFTIFILITLILYKLGFFRRKKKEELNALIEAQYIMRKNPGKRNTTRDRFSEAARKRLTLSMF